MENRKGSVACGVVSVSQRCAWDVGTCSHLKAICEVTCKVPRLTPACAGVDMANLSDVITAFANLEAVIVGISVFHVRRLHF